jgi:small GTP-binding protein
MSVFVKFHKINIYGLSGTGKKSFLKEMKKYNNPNYKESEYDKIIDERKKEELEDSQKLIERIEKVIIPLKNNTKLYLNVYLTNLDNIDYINSRTKYLIYETEIIIILIDITRISSFELAKNLLEKLNEIYKERKKKFEIFFIANKIDLDSKRVITNNEINELRDLYNYIQIFYLSLKSIENFENIIESLNTTLNKDCFKLYNLIKIKEPIKISSQDNIKTHSLMTIFLLGSSGVGKTSFIKRYFNNLFSNSNLSTLGIDVEKSFVEIDNQIIKLEVWDTAGQERLRSVPKKFYTKSDAFILMYDITKESTFNELTQWIKDIKEARNTDINDNNNDNNCIIYLTGNKIDNINEREIKTEDAENFAKKYNINYTEISCKDGINIYEIMENIIFDTSKRLDYLKEGFNLEKEKIKNIKKKKCCNG